MTKNEFIIECSMRNMQTMMGCGISTHENMAQYACMCAEALMKTISDMCPMAFDKTEQEKALEKEERENELAKINAEHEREKKEKQKERREELKNMPKSYVLFYSRKCSKSWRNESGEDVYWVDCHIKSSATLDCDGVLNKERYDNERYNKDPWVQPVYEYAFITEKQAMEMLARKKSKQHNSKKIDYVESDNDWNEFVQEYNLKVSSVF